MMLYNVPGRTVADLANETVLRLAEVPGIVGLKDATSDLVRHVDLRNRLPAAREFALYSGNDDTALPFMLLGGHGVISVTANVAPRADVGDVRGGARRRRRDGARGSNARLLRAAHAGSSSKRTRSPSSGRWPRWD